MLIDFVKQQLVKCRYFAHKPHLLSRSQSIVPATIMVVEQFVVVILFRLNVASVACAWPICPHVAINRMLADIPCHHLTSTFFLETNTNQPCSRNTYAPVTKLSYLSKNKQRRTVCAFHARPLSVTRHTLTIVPSGMVNREVVCAATLGGLQPPCGLRRAALPVQSLIPSAHLPFLGLPRGGGSVKKPRKLCASRSESRQMV